MTEFLARFFRFVGESELTGGDQGFNIQGGHNTPEETDWISIFDPTFGDSLRISIQDGLASSEWVEITKEEWEVL